MLSVGRQILPFVADTVGHMPGCYDLAGALAVTGLIVEKHVGGKGFEECRFGQTAEEQRLVEADIPLAQGADHPLMGRCRTRG